MTIEIREYRTGQDEAAFARLLHASDAGWPEGFVDGLLLPPEAIREFDAALDRAGVARETYVYEGAPHSFFDRTQEQHAEASADAWRHVLDFVGANTRGA